MFGDFIAENSCNAVDNKLSSQDDESMENIEQNMLSFNGRIDPILENEQKIDDIDCSSKLLAHDTTCMMYTNEKSPDLFEDEDDDDFKLLNESERSSSDVTLGISMTQKNETFNECENPFVKDEEILLKRLQMSLTGVLPPPSLTISQLNIAKMIELYKTNEKSLTTINEEEEDKTKNRNSDENEECKKKIRRSSLLAPTHTTDDVEKICWPEIKTIKSHGIHYNRSKYSEKFESLSLKYVERYIGAETSSSFTFTSPTSTKKRNMRMKLLGKSPGNRLSHLARRRAIFSSENLSGHSSKPSTSTSTSVSLSKSFSDLTSKRALFQSPAKSLRPTVNIPQITPEIANRAQKSKRVLFTPEKMVRCSSFT